MKKLLLIRHAKSSWDSSVASDFDRPLNDRGNRDAPEMAKRLLKQDIEIDAFVASPAKRALSTAALFAKEYETKEKNIITIPKLYEPSVEAFYNAVASLDNDFKTVAIFSHNPGITQFVNELTITKVDDMPTCSVFAVKCDLKKWEDFDEAEKQFWSFLYPKMLG